MKLGDLNLHDIGNTIQLTGAIYSGNGKTFECYFPEEHDLPTTTDVVPLLMSREEWKIFLRQTDMVETELLTKDPHSGEIIKAILRKQSRQIDQVVSWNVYRRDDYSCRYCGKSDVPLTVDHIVCWEVGGPSIEENLVSACKKCNRTRGNMSYEDWLSSPYYKKVSKGIGAKAFTLNDALIQTLPNIPRLVHKRSR